MLMSDRHPLSLHLPAALFVFFLFALSPPLSLADQGKARPRETDRGLVNGHVGKTVAPFTGTTLSGRRVSSDDRPKVLIIDLWGLNCGSCLDEMRALEGVYREYRDQGLEIWAVNTEDIPPAQIQEGLQQKRLQVSYDVLSDPGLAITRLFTSWFIPVTVIVDRNGVVQYYKIGYNENDMETIRAKVGNLLK